MRKIAGLEARTGDPASAERDFRKAIEFTLQAFALSEKNWNLDRKNIRPLSAMVTEEQNIAEILERLGQPTEALAYRSKALEHARLQFDADPKNTTAIRNLQDTTHAVDRFEWERAAEMGHFSVGIPDYLWAATGIATLKDRTLADIRASVAWSYNLVGVGLDADGDLPRIRRAEIKRLEMFEALLREEPQYVVNAKNGIRDA